MKSKFSMLLSTAAMVHVFGAAVLLAGGCVNSRENLPLPPGAYSPEPYTPDSKKVIEQEIVKTEVTEEVYVDPFLDSIVTPPANTGTANRLTEEHIPFTPETTYKVQKGDSLWKIAHVYGITVAELAEYNGLSDKALLKVGQTLKIPRNAVKKTTTTTVTKITETKIKPAQSNAGVYIVKPGDSLGLIAAKHGVKLDALKKANNIKDANMIKVNQEIIIPAGGKTPEKVAAVTKKPAAATINNSKKESSVITKVEPPKIDESSVEKVTPSTPVAENEVTDFFGSETTVNNGSTSTETTVEEATSFKIDNPPVVLVSDMTFEEVADLYGCDLAALKNLNPQHASAKMLPKGTKIIIPLF